jgi:hypothetical protein
MPLHTEVMGFPDVVTVSCIWMSVDPRWQKEKRCLSSDTACDVREIFPQGMYTEKRQARGIGQNRLLIQDVLQKLNNGLKQSRGGFAMFKALLVV